MFSFLFPVLFLERRDDRITCMQSLTTNIGGRLYLSVLRGNGLAQKNLTGKSDPYIIISGDFEGEKRRTKTISNNLNPEWNEDFELDFKRAFQDIEITVLDEDLIGSHEFMGKLIIHSADHAHGKETTQWYTLLPRTAKDDVSGKIELRISYKFIQEWDILFKGIISYQQKNYSTALSDLTHAIQQFPEEEELYSYRARCYTELKQYDLALADAQKYIELNPNSAKGYHRLGKVYFAAKDYTKSEEAFNLGLHLNALDEDCVQGIEAIKRVSIRHIVKESIGSGKASFARQDYYAAVKFFTAAIDGNPMNHILYVYRAIAYLGTNNVDAATTDALKVLELQPGWPKESSTCSGFLEKRGKININRKRRWFALRNYFMFYYDTGKETMANGVICLHNHKVSKKGSQKFKIITPARTYSVSAETELEASRWISVIENLREQKLELPIDEIAENAIYWQSTHTSRKASESAVALYNPLKLGTTLAKKIDSALTSVTILNPDKDGWLEKKGEYSADFKKRWCVLKNRHLNYFETQQEKNPTNVTPKGIILIAEKTMLHTLSESEWLFELITTQRTYKFRALSENEFKEWKNALMRLCNEAVRKESLVEQPSPVVPRTLSPKEGFPNDPVPTLPPPPPSASGASLSVGAKRHETATGPTDEADFAEWGGGGTTTPLVEVGKGTLLGLPKITSPPVAIKPLAAATPTTTETDLAREGGFSSESGQRRLGGLADEGNGYEKYSSSSLFSSKTQRSASENRYFEKYGLDPYDAPSSNIPTSLHKRAPILYSNQDLDDDAEATLMRNPASVTKDMIEREPLIGGDVTLEKQNNYQEESCCCIA